MRPTEGPKTSVLGACALLGLLLFLPGCERRSGPPPSIVIVTIDTLRADRMGSYGYYRDTSPNLDRFGADNLFFANAVTTMATTLPAHVSLFSSRYPLQTGVTANGKRLKRWREAGNQIRLFQQMLQDVGYSTAALVSALPVQRHTGIDVGFDFFSQPEYRGRKGKLTTDAVLEWLETPPTEPFYLWVHYFDPHSPYDPPEPFRSEFSTDEGLMDFLWNRGVGEERTAELLEINNFYDGEVRSVDHEVGRLFERLRDIGLWNESAVVVTSDHGEGLGQHGRIGHGEIYNEQLFVPLMMKLPKSFGMAPRRVERLVSITDILPTLVDTLELPIQESDRARFSGMNALDRKERRNYALAQRSSFRHLKAAEERGTREKFALVGLDWKYTLAAVEADRLHDMRTDHVELFNQVNLEPDRAASLRDRLLAEIACFSGAETDFNVIEETAPEVLEELKALGYL